MSAATPAIVIEEGREHLGVRTALGQLYLRRQLFRAIARVTTALACALSALCLVAFVDYVRPLPRAARIALLMTILLAVVFLLSRAIWFLAQRRTLVQVAREVESAAGNNQNALVTLTESFVDERDARAYMLARLERQALALLERIDERAVAPPEGAIRGASLLGFSLLLILALRLIAPVAFARESSRVVWLSSDATFTEQVTVNAETARNAANAPVLIEELRVRVLPP